MELVKVKYISQRYEVPVNMLIVNPSSGEIIDTNNFKVRSLRSLGIVVIPVRAKYE